MTNINAQLLAALSDLSKDESNTEQLIVDEFEQTGDLAEAIAIHTGLSASEIEAFYARTLDIDVMSQEMLSLYPILSAVSLKFMRHHNVLVLAEGDDAIRLITAIPYDVYPQQAVAMVSDNPVTLYLAKAELISQFLEKADSDAASVSELSDQIEDDFSVDDNDVDRLKNLASEAPIVRLVNVLVSQAMVLRASDIHIEPFERQLRVRYRIDGVLTDVDAPPAHSTAAIISRIKIMAKLNIAERRLPQDGRIQMRLQGQQVELRVSTVPSLFGESVVMRVLDKTQLALSFDSLGFGDANTARLATLIRRPHGIVLLTGPTGSGKTTTLYTALASLNSPEKKIMTVEDPVEYQLDGIMQMQVKPTIGLGFSDALRAIVRQDPDTIMIGEMRDYETASIAIQSALTGHLVFSTLHTNDAGSAITRLLDMGVEDYLITSTLAGVVAQRLVRTLCPICRQAVTPLPGLVKELGLDQYGYASLTLYEPVGCDACSHKGYKGRTVILEQMELNDALRSKILARADGTVIQSTAIESGMRTMRQDGIDKALAGVTSLDEVFSATQDT
jgi:general secretion pathway protein E